ncbi:lipase, partial [Vibrio sp. DBSS07]|nr:lipase [Vibrio paucivorans]
MDSFNYCVQCNPEKNWLELEFMSENDEPINGLIVSIAQEGSSVTHTQTTSGGKVLFADIAAGEWRATVSREPLLNEVEKYSSRKAELESPVESRASTELGAAYQNPKQYRNTTVGDFWDEAPDDDFLLAHHQGIDVNASEAVAGFKLSHNQTYVFELKALRSYMPMIVDTDDFSLVNSYTFAVLSKLAYATDTVSLDDGKSSDDRGSIDTVITKLKAREVPSHASNLGGQWLVIEVPYSQALDYNYYADAESGAEGYVLFNDDIAIIGVRGTEPYFEDRNRKEDTQLLKIVKATFGLQAVVADKVID